MFARKFQHHINLRKKTSKKHNRRSRPRPREEFWNRIFTAGNLINNFGHVFGTCFELHLSASFFGVVVSSYVFDQYWNRYLNSCPNYYRVYPCRTSATSYRNGGKRFCEPSLDKQIEVFFVCVCNTYFP